MRKYLFLNKLKYRSQVCQRYYSDHYDFDVLVVGGGHAGVEAANIACNLGVKTALVTQKLETIGEMSCNPSFGGVGKGHLLREIDALDGICPRICDLAGISFKVLNITKGPAAQGLRAQIDRNLYKKFMKQELFSRPIVFEEGSVEDLIIEKKNDKLNCCGVILKNNKKIRSKTTIITTGTFLNGLILIGHDKFSAGRMGDEPSIALAETFKKLNFNTGRLKTGTPPRIYKDTIDYDKLELIPPDEIIEPFSYMNDQVRIKPKDQLPTYLVFTDDIINKLVTSNINSSSYIREEAKGVRYCPSLEAKVLKFSTNFHQIWLEPECLDSDLIYPNGLTTGFPFDYQKKIVNSVKGLEKAILAKPGYSIEYDFINPKQLFPTLETKNLNNLYLAGQINGTTGYEEAAAQGILAGINAAGKTQDKENFLISRLDAFIGVIVDDLTRNGVTEPYRMMTARSEYRLYLRPDNADKRLTLKGYKYGCVSEERYKKFLETEKEIDSIKEELNNLNYTLKEWKEFSKTKNIKLRITSSDLNKKVNGLNLIENHSKIKIKDLFDLNKNLENYNQRLINRVQIESTYKNYIEIQEKSLSLIKKEESLKIDKDFDYKNPKLKLNNESIEMLTKMKPLTIHAALQIPNIPRETILKLIYHLKKNNQ